MRKIDANRTSNGINFALHAYNLKIFLRMKRTLLVNFFLLH
jgi:hypothetical protein